MKTFLKIFIIFLSLQSAEGREKSHHKNYYVPSTVSKQAQETIKSFPGPNNMSLPNNFDDLEAWKNLQDNVDITMRPVNDEVVKKYKPKITDTLLGKVKIKDIRPKNWKDNKKILIYVHGGAYILFHADTYYLTSVPIADATGLRTISIDYTLAPHAKFKEIIDQVISVVKALQKEGYLAKDIAICGDSAGGGLAAGSILKMRDDGMPPLGAVILISPWIDLTENGDTYFTLKNHDPILSYKNFLDIAANAYADKEDHKNPYVSPIYADFSKGFPPTLIQGGTKEILLSNFIRLYQALDIAKQTVKLDLYEGLWHVFQWQDFEESYLSRKKIKNFLQKHLNYD